MVTIFNIPPKSDLTFAKTFTSNAFLLLGHTDNSVALPFLFKKIN